MKILIEKLIFVSFLVIVHILNRSNTTLDAKFYIPNNLISSVILFNMFNSLPHIQQKIIINAMLCNMNFLRTLLKYPLILNRLRLKLIKLLLRPKLILDIYENNSIIIIL